MHQKAAGWLNILIYTVVTLGGAWLTLRFVIPWTSPFILAFAVAAILEMPVRLLVRHGWRRAIASAVLTLAVLGFLTWLTVKLSVWGISAVTRFSRQVPGLMTSLAKTLDSLEQTAFAYAAAAPEGVADYLEMAIEAIGESFYDLPALLSQWALDLLSRAAQASPDLILFVVTAGIGSYFISASFPQIMAFVRAQIPDSLRRRYAGMGRELGAGLGGMLRAQLILMALTFFQLLLVFLLLKIKSAAGLAAVTALVDALPVFGTGIILIPWSLYCLLLGEGEKGIALLLSWLGANLIRNCAQAKLVGDQIGLDPVASLLAVYVGWQVCGVWGMLLFPLAFVAVQQLNDRGVINLWKNP